MPDSSIAIANQFLIHLSSSLQPAQMKLQKLVYIAHGWNLAIYSKNLVADENPEAWDNGPVFRYLYTAVRYKGYTWFSSKNALQLTNQNGDPVEANLSLDERGLIEAVWQRYGDFSAKQLSDMTHQPGTPWTNAYLSIGRNAAIEATDIRRHYRLLGLAAKGNG